MCPSVFVVAYFPTTLADMIVVCCSVDYTYRWALDLPVAAAEDLKPRLGFSASRLSGHQSGVSGLAQFARCYITVVG